MANPILRLTDPPMHSPAVTRLQEALCAGGADLKPDGWFGAQTEVAVKAFQAAHGLPADGVVGAKTWTALLPVEVVPEVAGARLLDRRGLHPHPKLWAKRDHGWSKITGVTLHQTACELGNRPERWDTLNAHVGVLRDGTVLLCNDPTDFIWHAQGLSQHTIGIEIDGIFPGKATGTDKLTSAQVAGLDVLFAWLVTAFKANGQVWRSVHAHRQSSINRRGDPGAEIWKRVALPWIERLRTRGGDWGEEGDGGEGWHTGDGRGIPRAWNPDRTEAY